MISSFKALIGCETSLLALMSFGRRSVSVTAQISKSTQTGTPSSQSVGLSVGLFQVSLRLLLSEYLFAIGINWHSMNFFLPHPKINLKYDNFENYVISLCTVLQRKIVYQFNPFISSLNHSPSSVLHEHKDVFFAELRFL